MKKTSCAGGQIGWAMSQDKSPLKKAFAGRGDVLGFPSGNGDVGGSLKYSQGNTDRNLGSIVWLAQAKGKKKVMLNFDVLT